MSDNKPDSVPGLGFKDKEKALETMKNLEGRDPDYQKLAIRGLVGRAKRVLTLTKDKEKLQNINDAMKIFEDWLKGYEKNNVARENRPYLALASVKTLISLKKKYNIVDEKADAFLEAYKTVKGEYKNLRTVESAADEPTWDIVRNTHLKPLMKRVDEEDPDLWDDDLPTKDHMELIVWAYSPEAQKIKKTLSKMEEKLGKEDEDIDDSDSDDDKMSENGDGDKKKGSKRKSEGSSSDDEESPKKKSKE